MFTRKEDRLLKTLNDFYDYVTSQGIDKNAIYEETGEGFAVVSFRKEEKKIAYITLQLFFTKTIMM